jgi:2-keto-4-pentenoate hydratase/2-oxohepta-3-ene-1,7-dioic acid hydratase in catechol pathway
MRLGHLHTPAGPRLFVERDGRRVLIEELMPDAPPTLDALIAAPGDWRERIGAAAEAPSERTADPSLRTAPAVLSPSAVVAIGLNYLDHCREFGTDPPSTPIVFAKLPASLCGDGDEIVWRTDVTSAVDWEAELGVVIGRPARDVPEDAVDDVIFGYTVVNDVTARDIQRAEQQWVRAKSLDTFCPLGPVVVTHDELPDSQALTIRSCVNGEQMQDSSTAEMIFPVATLVSYLSRCLTLRPGDVIATGTPLGVGGFRTPPLFLSDGDVVEVEVEEIGVLRNTCRELAVNHDETETE